MSINSLSRLAQIAQASYESLQAGDSGDVLAAKLQSERGEFASAQAQEFAVGNRVVLQFNDDLPSSIGNGSSLSLTVFKDTTGNLTLAIRGTAELADVITADADIFRNGTAYGQIVALYNWWLRATTPAGISVQQFSVQNLRMGQRDALSLPAGRYLVRSADALATGELRSHLNADGDGMIDVTGHSLGGHLAMAFAALFPIATASVTAFNAPGFYDSTSNRAFFSRLSGLFPDNVAIGHKVTNVLGSEVTAKDGAASGFHAVAGLHSRPGSRVDVSIENQWLSSEPLPPPARNHSQMVLADALAVHALFDVLQPGALESTMPGMLQASSNREHAGLEGLVQALRTTLGLDWSTLPAGHDQREALYQAIDAVENSGWLTALAEKVRLTPVSSNLANRALARTDFQTLVALETHAPFILDPIGAEGQAALDALWQSAGWQTTYQAWVADRASLLTGAEPANFSDAYLSDRAGMLVALVERNARNIDPLTAATEPYQGRNVLFLDLERDERVAAGALPSAATTVDVIAFGKLDDDLDGELWGGDGDDRLHGLAGADILRGYNGDDLLDGGSGADQLHGGRGNDTLIGGPGDDRLLAGAGADLLRGGAGDDRYVLDARDGAGSLDRVDDADGVGVVEVVDASGASFVLSGGRQVAEGLWLDADGRFSYRLADSGEGRQALLIAGAGIQARIEDWRADRSLGITLQVADPPDAPATGRTILGDLAVTTGADDLGNPITTGQPEPGRHDKLYDSGGSDLIDSGGGMDAIHLIRGGDDLVLAGSGRDAVYGGMGHDWIESGAGRDYAFGSAGDDTLWGAQATSVDAILAQTQALGDDEADLQHGGSGDDLVVGGASADGLLGEDGADRVVGGAGDDHLFGDRLLPFTQIFEWNWRREVVTGSDGTVSRTLLGFGLEGYDGPDFGSDQGSDVLLGGAGADWIFGDGGDDVLDGGDGHDVVYGGAGADVVEGGAGDDELTGDGDDVGTRSLSGVPAAAHGNDLIDAGAGNDRIDGSGGSDYLAGGDGDDQIQGDAIGLALEHHGDDFIDGGAGNDLLFGNGGDDVIDGGIGIDQLVGEAGADELDGGDGDDTIFGDSPSVDPALHGDDRLIGGAGDDALVGGGGRDRLFGGAGGDTLYGDDLDLVDSAHGGDRLEGGDGDDQLWGMGGDDGLDGGAGDDVLMGGAGHDTLAGGEGIDVLDGGAGNDTYIVAAGTSGSYQLGVAERVGDLDGSNTLVLEGFTAQTLSLHPMAGSDDLIALQGDAVLVIQGLTSGHVAEVRFGDGSSYSGPEFFGRTWIHGVDTASTSAGAQLLGGRQADRLVASGGRSSLWGGLGDDQISADGGANTFHYRLGDGRDTVTDASPLFDAGGQRQRSTLAFGFGIAAADVRLSHADGALELQLPDGGTVRLPGFDPADPLAAASVDRFGFADGSERSRVELLARGFDLQGTAADETLAGTALADRLNGGAGVDLLRGGGGADTYRFEVGDGFDVVADADPAAGSGDLLKLGPAFFIDAVGAGRVGDDLVLRAGDDAVTLRAYFSGGPDAVERIEFDDGTEWTPQEIRARLLRGTAGDDLIVGDDQANVIAGQAGNDRLEGRGGDDDYLFGIGDGADRVVDTGGNDRVRLGPGIAPAAVQLRSAAGDLVLDFGDGDRLTLAGYLSGPADPGFIEGIEFDDGTVWTHADIVARLPVATEGDDLIEGSADDDVLDGLGGHDTLRGGAGHDRLIGGRGNDRLYGGPGNDVFEFAAGDGLDLVSDLDPVSLDSGGAETLQFGAGITPADTALARQGADLALLPGPGDQVLIDGYFGRGDFETIRFGDGTVWSQKTVAARLPIDGSAGSDTLTGTMAADVINGLGSGDQIDAGGGDDKVDGGAGHDWIHGGDGNDQLFGGTDTARKITYRDAIYGDAGSDILRSGSAPADMDGGAGNDILIGTGLLDGGSGNNLLVGTGGSETLLTRFTGHSIVIGGPGIDVFQEWGAAPWDTLGASRNIYLYNNGDGKEGLNQDANTKVIDDVVSLGKASYSQLKTYEPRDQTYFSLMIGKVEVPGTIRIPGEHNGHDTKYLQFIVPASDYAPTSTDPLRNRKVVVVDWDAYGRDFWATRDAGASWNLLDKLRQHIAWSSDTHAIGGAIAYQYGTAGHIDAVTDEQRFAILADPSLGLLGQPIAPASGAPMMAGANDALADRAAWSARRVDDRIAGIDLDQQARSLLTSMASFASSRAAVMDAAPAHAERFASLASLAAAGGLDWR